jgi:hypothetical protein
MREGLRSERDRDFARAVLCQAPFAFAQSKEAVPFPCP